MDFYPNSALVAPIIPANQQLQTAAQTAALQQRSALEAQQTQGAALANQEAQLTLQDQQLWAQHMLGTASQSSNPNNASTTVANDLSNPSGATSQVQASIPSALVPSPDQPQALPSGATTAAALANNTAALAPQIPPMLARVAPNQGAAPSLVPGTTDQTQATSQSQAAATPATQAAAAPISTQPHPLAGLPSTGPDFAAQMQNAMNDPRIRPTYKMQMQKQIVGMANAQAELSKNQTEATQKQQALQQGYRDDSVRLFNGYLAGDPWETTRNRAIAEGIPGADKWPTTDPGIQQIQTWQHSLRGLNAEKDFFTLTYPKMQQDGSNVAAQTADQITPDGSNYPTWRANQVKQNFAMDQILPQTYQGPQTITQIKQLPLSAGDRLKAPGEIAKSDEAVRQNDIAKLSAPTTQLDYAKEFYDIPADRRGKYPDPKDWTTNTPKQLTNTGLTPAQRATNDEALVRAQNELIKSGINPDLAKQATDQNISPQSRADAMKKINQQSVGLKVNEEVGKQLGVINALTGGYYSGGGGGQSPGGTTSTLDANTAETPTLVNGRNEAILSKAPPGLAAQVRMIADGRALPPPLSRNNPRSNAIWDLLGPYDPSFDATNASQRFKTANDFSPSGKSGQAINAIGTALKHASTLSDLADNLNNTNYPKFNNIQNWIKNNTGSPDVQAFQNTQGKLSEEFTRAWRGIGGNEADLQRELGVLNSASSPQALKKVLSNDVDLLYGKYSELQNGYKGSMGRALPPEKGISKEATQAAQKIQSKVSNTAQLSNASKPQKGDKQSFNGSDYVFDGNAWQKNKTQQ